jgi:hypothetical protein
MKLDVDEKRWVKCDIDAVWIREKPVVDGFWKDKRNRIKYMKWLGHQLGIKKPEDWFKISKSAFHKNRGSGLLACCYGDSPIRALREYQQEITGKEWLFNSTSQGFWAKRANRKRYLEWLSVELNIKEYDDWYQLTRSVLNDNHGGRLLQGFYQGSVIKLLNDNFPEYEWLEWKLRCTPHSFWKEKANRIKYLAWLGKKVGFTRYPSWKKLTRQDFIKNGGEWLFMRYYKNSVTAAVDEYIEYRQEKLKNSGKK